MWHYSILAISNPNKLTLKLYSYIYISIYILYNIKQNWITYEENSNKIMCIAYLCIKYKYIIIRYEIRIIYAIVFFFTNEWEKLKSPKQCIMYIWFLDYIWCCLLVKIFGWMNFGTYCKKLAIERFLIFVEVYTYIKIRRKTLKKKKKKNGL